MHLIQIYKMSLKRSFEEVENSNLTNQEVEKLHKTYKKKIDESDTESNTDTDTDTDSESNNDKKFIFKKGKRTKETTMLYMFKKYELLQTECNQHKNKLYNKLKSG